LDNQVLDFITRISPLLADEQIHLYLSSFGEEQRTNVNQLVNILSRDGFPQSHLTLSCLLAKIGYVPNGGNKLKSIKFYLGKELEIANLIEFLAIPRPDGQQQVVNLSPELGAGIHDLGQKIFESIKQVTILIYTFNAVNNATIYIY
jgi:hypothetical protein